MHKTHIGIYGRTNSGKSSLLNFITGQSVSIVSSARGTTTDPVRRSFELIDYGPVVFIDTAGLDDGSELGASRVAAAMATVAEIEFALIVVRDGISPAEKNLMELLDDNDVPYLIIYNKIDTGAQDGGRNTLCTAASESEFTAVSDTSADYIETFLTGSPRPLLDRLRAALSVSGDDKIPPFFGDKLHRGDIILMVCPIDSQAPAGRIILPQVQALRAALDLGAVSMVVQPSELRQALCSVTPSLIVTDSQVYSEVSPIATAAGIPLTTFSILLAAVKGDPEVYGRGLSAADNLKEGDRVLVLENCSHQTNCDDIGRVRIPRWLEQYTGSRQQFTFIAGRDPLPADLGGYSLIVQCGGCMVTRAVVQSRVKAAVKAGVPITNYGMLIKKLRS